MEWKDTMSEASEMINNDLKNMLGPEEKKQVMNIMNAAQMGLAGAAKAKTQQELQMAMMQAVMGALMSAGGVVKMGALPGRIRGVGTARAWWPRRRELNDQRYSTDKLTKQH